MESMRILLLMLLSTKVWAQKVDREKIRNDYALEFVKNERRTYDEITMRLTQHPVFLGDMFESPREFTIYKVDCPPDTFSLDSDMYLTVPVGTKVRLNGEEFLGLYRLYELGLSWVNMVSSEQIYTLTNSMTFSGPLMNATKHHLHES